MKTIEIQVDGMSCGGCVKKITKHFKDKEGIENTNVSLEDKLVIIQGADDLSNMFIRNELIELGFPVISIKKI